MRAPRVWTDVEPLALPRLRLARLRPPAVRRWRRQRSRCRAHNDVRTLGRRQDGHDRARGDRRCVWGLLGHHLGRTKRLHLTSPDIYCYACDDAKLDPQLAKHLANFGIEVATQTKTEKSMTELVRPTACGCEVSSLIMSSNAASGAEPQL